VAGLVAGRCGGPAVRLTHQDPSLAPLGKLIVGEAAERAWPWSSSSSRRHNGLAALIATWGVRGPALTSSLKRWSEVTSVLGAEKPLSKVKRAWLPLRHEPSRVLLTALAPRGKVLARNRGITLCPEFVKRMAKC
jgi:hypothetical protein